MTTSSLAFSVGDGFEGGRTIEERVTAVVSVLLDLRLIGSTVPNPYDFGLGHEYPVGENLAQHGEFRGVSVMHGKEGKPFPVAVDTQGDPETFPKATILIVFHDFYPAGYESFVDPIQEAFAGQLEEHVVAF